MNAVSVSNIFSNECNHNADFENVVPADKYVKRVVNNAQYMCVGVTRYNAVCCFIPYFGEIVPNKFVYKINDHYFENIWLVSHEKLVELYNEEMNKKGYEQVSLF